MSSTIRHGYAMHVASVMSFYRDNFEQTREFPVAYASANVAVVLGSNLISMSKMVMRFEYVSPIWSWLPRIVLDHLLATFVFILIFYIAHSFILIRNNTWRFMIRDFESLNRRERNFYRLSSLIILVASLSWIVVESYYFV
jgi:hypothetical protein